MSGLVLGLRQGGLVFMAMPISTAACLVMHPHARTRTHIACLVNCSVCSYDHTLAELRRRAYVGHLGWGVVVHRKADDLYLPLRQVGIARRGVGWRHWF